MIIPENIKLLRDHPIKKSLFPDRYEENQLYIALVPHTFMLGVKGDAGIGISVSHDGYILEENCPQIEDYINRVMKERLGIGKSHIFKIITDLIFIANKNAERKGRYLALNTQGSGSFWHWMMENVVKAVIAMDAGFDGYYLIPHFRFAKESLELIGVPEDRIILFDGNSCILETLYVPQMPSLQKFPILIQKVRDKFLYSIGKNSLSKERIYIARNKRSVVNESELTELLDKYKFKRVIMENYPLSEQIRIASEAGCMIMPHGAGMVHTMFMPPHSLVLELFSPLYINPCMLPVIDYLKHRYYMIPSNNNHIIQAYPHILDIEANIPMIELTLRRELEG